MKASKPSSFVLRKIPILMVLFLLGAAFMLAFVPVAHATFSNTLLGSLGAATCSGGSQSVDISTFGSYTQQAGDLILVVFAFNPQTVTIISITDNQGDAWARVVSGGIAAGGINTEMWYTDAQTATRPVVSVTFSGSATSCLYYWEAYDVDNYVPAGSPLTSLTFTSASSATGNNIPEGTPFLSLSSNSLFVMSAFMGGTTTATQSNTWSSLLTTTGTGAAAGSGATEVIVTTPVFGYLYTGTPATYATLQNAFTWTGASGTFALGVIWGTFIPGTQTAPATPQVQTIGSNVSSPFTGHNAGSFTMVNNTIYLYCGNALGQSIAKTLTVGLNSTIGSGSHTLQLLLYDGSQAFVAVGAPMFLAYSHSFVITPGTQNQIIIVQVDVQLNNYIPTQSGNTWCVGTVGDNKIKLATSSLSGLTTQTGNPSTAAQPASFTSTGTSVTTKLDLSALASYQSQVIITQTSTTTQSATSTTVVTSTSTVTTIGAVLFSTASNWPVIFLILLFPAGLFLGITKTLAGALLGLMVGSVIGLMMGILPATIFIGIVISLTAIAFIARERSS